jgi:hypothetical protein
LSYGSTALVAITRLFGLLDYDAKGEEKPLLTVIDGRNKPFRTTLYDADYVAVRCLGDYVVRRTPGAGFVCILGT